jgi:hypothetical protein
MRLNHHSLSIGKKQAIALLGLSFAAGYLWRRYITKSRSFEIPGSRSTIPDDFGHYDMDGVSFDDKCGVVVSSDGRTPVKVKGMKMKRKRAGGELPQGTN